MKRTRNVARLLTLVLVLCMVLIPLTSCNQKQSVNGYCTVVVATEPETVYTVDLDKLGTVNEGLMSVLDYLKENNGFTYEKTVSDSMGAYLTKVLSLDPATITEGHGYIQLFTSVEKDFDVSEYATEMTYKGTKLVSSGLGASSMTIQADAVYYIKLAVY